MLILIFYKDLDYDDLTKHTSKTQNAYYFGLAIAMTRTEVVIFWIIVDLVYSVFVTVTYNKFLKIEYGELFLMN